MTASKTTLTQTEIDSALSTLAGWTYADGQIQRDYVFTDFLTAIRWINAVAIDIDAQDHHPNWSNVYNRIHVDLWSHDSGGVTARDVRLAHTLESAFQAFQ